MRLGKIRRGAELYIMESLEAYRRRLQQHGLRTTQGRVALLAYFDERPQAHTLPELEKAVASVDRATLYRTLQTFVDCGLLHRVPNEGAVYFAVSHSQDEREHAHFKCTECGRVICITQAEAPRPDLPPGFRILSRHWLVQGTCDRCGNKIAVDD